MRSRLPALLLELENRGKLVGILCASAAVAMLDVVTVALIFPIFLIVVRPRDSVIPAPFNSVLGDTPETQTLYLLGGALVAVVLLKNVAMIMVMRMQIHAAADGAIRLSQRLLRGYLSAPLEFHLSRTNAQYTRSLRDLPVEIFYFGGLGYCNRFAEIAGASLMVLALAMLEPFAILSALTLLGALAYLNHRIVGEFVRNWSRRSATLTRGLYALIGEVFPSIKVVKATGAEDRLYERVEANLSESARTIAKLRFAQMTIRPLSEIVMMIAAVVILTVTLWEKERAIEVVPFLATFTYAIFRLLPSATRISTFSNEIKRVEPLVDELREDLAAIAPFLEDRKAGKLSRTIQFSKTLELREVGYRYPGGEGQALTGVNLKINFGEVIGVAGSSGAGKSTLVDVLLGLLEPSDGELLVDGSPPARDGRGAVGYVPQNNLLLNVSARENIAFGSPSDEIDDALVWEAVTAARLEETIAALPGGLDGIVGEHGGNLSGGQRQRFGIARALYGRPSLLVLDEATSDLDTRTEYEIASAIDALRGQTTIVLIAHRMHLLRSCDRVLFMRDGRIEAAGSYEELLATSPEFQELATMTERY